MEKFKEVIGLLGGGPANIFTAIFLARKYKDLKIIIFEQKEMIGKKFIVSGNGRCNINHDDDNINKYNNPQFVEKYLKEFNINKQKEALKSIGIYLTNLHDGYLYPVNLSGKTVHKVLIKQIEKCKNIEVLLRTKCIDYRLNNNNKIDVLFSDNSSYDVDKLVISCGGKSSPILGSDGSMFSILKNKGYKINELKPGLCPIKIEEDVSSLFGEKIRGEAKLIQNEKILYKEKGEIVFKKDGLGGILAFNLASIIQRNNYEKIAIKIDCLDETIKEVDLLKLNKNIDNVLLPFLQENLAKYIYKLENINIDCKLNFIDASRLINRAHNLTFNVSSFYDFNDSQVSIGGLKIEEINFNFESKKEKGVYFLGEMLDIDALCGGYNLKWALVSALYFTKNFKY